MKKHRLKIWVRLIAIIAIIYVAGGVALYFVQDKLLFHPEPLPSSYQYQFNAQFKEIDLVIDDKKTLSIVQFTVPDSLCRGVVLYFHGNMENINRYAPVASSFTRNFFEVWMLDYPGFGKSTGERSEKVMYEDAKRLYRMARAKYNSDSIVIYGRSIGTGVALQLASVEKSRELILETPYYNIDALANHYFPFYPVKPLTKYEFPNHLYIKYIETPVTIFHGTKDEVVPYSHSKRLLALNHRARLLTIENATHNDLINYSIYHRSLDSILSD